jgi:hypothetical protein
VLGLRPRCGPPVPGSPWTRSRTVPGQPSGGVPPDERVTVNFLFDENADTPARLRRLGQQFSQVLNDLIRAGRLSVDLAARESDLAVDSDLVEEGLGYTPVPPTRRIIAGVGLAGGGTLDHDVTIWALPQERVGMLKWEVYGVSYQTFSTGATVKAVTIRPLAVNEVLHAVVLRHTTEFRGGAISAYVLDIGYPGTASAFVTGYDVFTVPPAAPPGYGGYDAIYHNPLSATEVQVRATSTGANLDAATSGAATVWLLVSALP